MAPPPCKINTYPRDQHSENTFSDLCAAKSSAKMMRQSRPSFHSSRCALRNDNTSCSLYDPLSLMVTVSHAGHPMRLRCSSSLRCTFPFLLPLNMHSAGGMNPAATAASSEHVVKLAVQRDLQSLLPSTTGTVLPRTANVGLFCDPLSLWWYGLWSQFSSIGS